MTQSVFEWLNSADLGDTLGAAAVVTLVVALAVRELAAASERWQPLTGRFLAAIIPLFIVSLIVIIRRIVAIVTG